MGNNRVSPATSANGDRSVFSPSVTIAGPMQADAAVALRLSSPPVMHLKTSSAGFAICWLILLLLHAVNVGYYIGAAVLYRAMRWTNVSFQLTTYSIGISVTQYNNISTIHWVVAALHGLLVLAMVLGLLQTRRLMFLPALPPWLAHVCAKLLPGTISTTKTSLSRRLSSCSERSVVVTKSIFGREGLLGVDNAYFDHLLLARELVETSLQTIQAYRMSYLLPRVWLVRFYVGLLITNCWSMPILHRYYANRHVERRMMSLLCDAVLDMVSSIGVSFWIFATYAPQYTDPAFGFPFTQWFDDVWFTNMQQEFQMMMVVSWADMAARLVFAGGLLQCMQSIKEMLTPPDEAKRLAALTDESNAAAIVKRDADKDKAVREPHKTGPAKAIVPQKETISHGPRAIHFLLEKVAPAFFVVFGFAILVIHVVAETRVPSLYVPCQLQLHPWFVSKPACSLVELDCHQLGELSGSQESMIEAWNTYEFEATARLFVRHCPQLEMPPALHQFRQVTSVKLYNTSIVSWPVEAAFITTFHKKMRAVFAVRTNFADGELPPGLLTMEFPPWMASFTTTATNLKNLPDNLHKLWPPGMTLAFERSHLRVVPPTLAQMNPFLVSLAGSPITTVPAELFEAPQLQGVLLSYTLVQELPRVVANPSPRLFLMFLEGTNVSTFWSWMEPFVQYSFALNNNFFTAAGSRFCMERAAIVAGNRTSFSITTAEPGVTDLASVMDVSTPQKLEFSKAAVLCGPSFPFYFPLELQDTTTAIR